MQALAWLRRDRQRGPALLVVPESRARRIVLWALTGWTALGGLAMVVAQNDFSRMMAAGLKDRAGERLLGVQFLLLAAVYGLAARRQRPDGSHVPGWLPLAGEAATAAVILYDTIAGNVGFGSSWPALCVALLFAMLLAGFSLAGQPAVHSRPSEHALRQREAVAQTPPSSSPGGHFLDAPTQRIGRVLTPEELTPDAHAAAAQPPQPSGDEPRSDERVLGA